MISKRDLCGFFHTSQLRLLPIRQRLSEQSEHVSGASRSLGHEMKAVSLDFPHIPTSVYVPALRAKPKQAVKVKVEANRQEQNFQRSSRDHNQ